MFVGFIAVIVILLVIVGLMSTGATSGSGGVDQTKATKVISELSGLAQNIGFYKTTQASSDYAGLTDVDNLVDAGIVDSGSIEALADGSVIEDGETNPGAIKAIKSKALDGIFYAVAVNTKTNKAFNVKILVDQNNIGADGSLAKALEQNYKKLSEPVNYDANEDDTVAADEVSLINENASGKVDGAATISFK